MIKIHIISKKAIYFLQFTNKREAKYQALLYKGLGAEVFINFKGKRFYL